MNKRVISVLIILVATIGAGLWLRFSVFSKLSHMQEVVAFPLTNPTSQKIFAMNPTGLFSYDPSTKEMQQIIAVTNPNSWIDSSQKLTDGMLGFELDTQGNNTSTDSKAFYTLNLNTGVLTDEAPIPPTLDGLDFIASGEFAYAQPVNPSVGFNENYDNLFLFRNGTTTNLGSLPNKGLYGSDMNQSPDGNHIFFANNIYDMASGAWKPTPADCAGNQSAWLNNDVLVLKTVNDDSGQGVLCYYDLSTGTEKTLGTVQEFSVVGNDILYEPVWPTTGLSQIRMYDFSTKTDEPLIANAQLSMPAYDPNNLGWVLYQPVVEDKQCLTIDCLGGAASGSLMLFNLNTNSSSPIMVGTSTDFESWF